MEITPRLSWAAFEYVSDLLVVCVHTPKVLAIEEERDPPVFCQPPISELETLLASRLAVTRRVPQRYEAVFDIIERLHDFLGRGRRITRKY